jgi:hypothetical protein
VRAPHSRMRLAILPTSISGRNVVGPERITRSNVASGSDESSFSRSSPSTTRSLFTTTQASQSAARTRSRASSTFSVGAQVGTSRRVAYGGY